MKTKHECRGSYNFDSRVNLIFERDAKLLQPIWEVINLLTDKFQIELPKNHRLKQN